MKHIAIFEPNKKINIALTMIFSQTNYQVSIFNYEAELLKFVLETKVDLIISSTEFVRTSAKDFLKTIKNTNITKDIPVMMIGNVSSKYEIVELLKLGALDFIVKTELSKNKLETRVAKVFDRHSKMVVAKQIRRESIDPLQFKHKTVESIKREQQYPQQEPEKPKTNPLLLLSPEVLKKRLQRIAAAKAIPFIATEILDMTSSINTEINNIQQLVKLDAAITAKVLKFANSAYYRRSRTKIFNLSEAIRVIGFNGIRELVLGISMIDSFIKSQDGSRLDRLKLFYHSLTAAVIAREIASTIKYSNPELCFVTALLHNLGQAIIDDNFTREYIIVHDKAHKLNIPLDVIEEKLLGINHMEMAARIMKSWSFSDELVDPIKYHHYDINQIYNLPTPHRSLVAIVRIACLVAQYIGADGFNNDALETVPQRLLGFLNLHKNDLLKYVNFIDDSVKELCQILLLHLDHRELLNCNLLSKYTLIEPYKILVLENNEDYIGPIEFVYKLLRCDVMVTNDLITSYKRSAPKVIAAYINNEQKMKVFLNDMERINKNFGYNICILLIAPKALCQKYDDLKYTQNRFVFLEKPFKLIDVLNAIDQFNFRIESTENMTKNYKVQIDKIYSLNSNINLHRADNY